MEDAEGVVPRAIAVSLFIVIPHSVHQNEAEGKEGICFRTLKSEELWQDAGHPRLTLKRKKPALDQRGLMKLPSISLRLLLPRLSLRASQLQAQAQLRRACLPIRGWHVRRSRPGAD